MKKLILTMMLSIPLFAAMACTNSNNNDASNADATSKASEAVPEANVSKDSKVLVAYFSATGVTKGVAKDLAEVTGGVLYEITPEKPYTEADLDWHDKKSRSSVEMADLKSRPAIKGKVENIGDYDVVFIGFPIWWYTAPTIVNTFIEANDLKGKTLIPFATSGGSTIDKACTDLKATYPDLKWQKGRLLNDATPDTIRTWLKL